MVTQLNPLTEKSSKRSLIPQRRNTYKASRGTCRCTKYKNSSKIKEIYWEIQKFLLMACQKMQFSLETNSFQNRILQIYRYLPQISFKLYSIIRYQSKSFLNLKTVFLMSRKAVSSIIIAVDSVRPYKLPRPLATCWHALGQFKLSQNHPIAVYCIHDYID